MPLFSTITKDNVVKLAAYHGYVEAGEKVELQIQCGEVISRGNFGDIVVTAFLLNRRYRNLKVAIKQLTLNNQYKSPELDITCNLKHPNIVSLLYYNDHKDEQFMIFEYISTNLGNVLQQHAAKGQKLHPSYIKLFTYQLLSALEYIHGRGYCHRDIKPKNILIDPQTSIAKICDFGSAKEMKIGEASIAYICSRYYRAPELLLGYQYYTTAIDIWSTGCIIGEMVKGTPLFNGKDSTDMLALIFSQLGTPSLDDIVALNPAWKGMSVPQNERKSWSVILDDTNLRIEAYGVMMLSQLLTYNPRQRPTATETLASDYFGVLNSNSFKLPNGSRIPNEVKDLVKSRSKNTLYGNK